MQGCVASAVVRMFNKEAREGAGGTRAEDAAGAEGAGVTGGTPAAGTGGGGIGGGTGWTGGTTLGQRGAGDGAPLRV